jgi:hypothetical protein
LSPNWDTLFMHSRVNVLDGEPDIQQTTCPSDKWDADLPQEHGEQTPLPDPPHTVNVLEGASHSTHIPNSHTPASEEDVIEMTPASEGAVTNVQQASSLTPPPNQAAMEAPISESTMPDNRSEEHVPASLPHMQPSPPMPQVNNTTSAAQSGRTTRSARPAHPSQETARPGWNQSHGHHTRFKERLQVNLSYPDATHSPPSQPHLHQHIADQFSAMAANIEATA